MQNTNSKKVAIVVKGYYKAQENEVFGIYLLDDSNNTKLIMIPCDEQFASEEEVFDMLGDTLSRFQKRGYKVLYDFKEETKFDVSEKIPVLEKV